MRARTKELLANAQVVDGVRIVTVDGTVAPDHVKTIAFTVRREAKEPTVFVGATEFGGKPLLTVALTDDLVSETRNASKLVREAAKKIKGGGGGQPFFAQAGGKDASGLDAAKVALIELLKG